MNNCDNCKAIDCDSTQFIHCTACRKITHTCDEKLKLNDIDPELITKVYSSGFRYYCDTCLDNLRGMTNAMIKTSSYIEHLYKKLSAVEIDVKEIKQKVQNAPTHENMAATYASVMREEIGKGEIVSCDSVNDSDNNLKMKDNTLIITPKNSELNDIVVKKKIQNAIDPVESKISGLHHSKNNKFILKSKENDREKFLHDVSAKLGEEFSVRFKDGRNPTLKIVRFINDDYTEEEIIKAIKSQNGQFIRVNDHIRIVKMYKAKVDSNFTTIIIETDQKLHNTLLEKGEINIIWSNCKIYDALEIKRCFKCCGFSHIAKDCKHKSIVCSKCSGPHKFAECTSSYYKCINCSDLEKRERKKVDVNHNAFDKNCLCAIKKREYIKNSLSQ